ncbi:unnamed protein product [Effrenium voratum]|nr:unnamed protein product [Effrenium voratum]
MSMSKAFARHLHFAIPVPKWRHIRPLVSYTRPLLRAPGQIAGRWSSTSASEPKAWLRRGAVLTLKLVFLWVPALAAWTSVVSGVALDLRTPEEAKQEEQEAQRLERFFDVDHLPEVEYVAEWAAKEQALAGMVDKLMRSKTVQEALGDRSDGLGVSNAEEKEEVMEFSYVLRPLEANRLNSLDAEISSEGYRPWNPRVVLAHASGGLMLVSMRFQHLHAANGRNETWACTKLQAELIARQTGEALGEPICDIQGPMPHGVRYMRI